MPSLVQELTILNGQEPNMSPYGPNYQPVKCKGTTKKGEPCKRYGNWHGKCFSHVIMPKCFYVHRMGKRCDKVCLKFGSTLHSLCQEHFNLKKKFGYSPNQFFRQQQYHNNRQSNFQRQQQKREQKERKQRDKLKQKLDQLHSEWVERERLRKLNRDAAKQCQQQERLRKQEAYRRDYERRQKEYREQQKPKKTPQQIADQLQNVTFKPNNQSSFKLALRLLGLTSQSSKPEIKKNFKQRILKFHPDKVQPQNQEACKVISRVLIEAYKFILSFN